MPIISGGGGGAAFNGGTITQPLLVQGAATSLTAGLLEAKATSKVGGGSGFKVIDASSSLQLGADYTAGGFPVLHVGGNGFEGDVQFWHDFDNDSDATLEVNQGATGVVLMKGLPTSDPGVSGQLYTVVGVLHVSP